MDAQLQALTDQIVADKRILKKKMFWEMNSNATATMSAFLYASHGRRADIDRYMECKKLLKKKASILSEFRGIAFTLVITKMTLAEDPEAYVDGALAVYKKLRSLHKFTASPYMVMAALTIYENGGLEMADENLAKLEDIYKKLKAEHPLLVWDSDRALLALMVVSGLNIDLIAQETENCYEAVKKLSLDKDAVHSLAQILALNSKSTDDKAAQVTHLVKAYKEAHLRINKSIGLSSVGALTFLNISDEDIVAKTAEVDSYLKTQKGFKWYSVYPKYRHLYSQLIVAISCMPENSEVAGALLANAVTAIIIQEILTLIIVSQTTAMVASSNRSSSASGS